MAKKRHPRDDEEVGQEITTKHKGFSVGPFNLPDGVHKRKVQKIKQNLIHMAQVKKSYAALQERKDIKKSKTPLLELRSEWQAMLHETVTEEHRSERATGRRGPEPKSAPLRKEYSQAQRRIAEDKRHQQDLHESRLMLDIRRQQHDQLRYSINKARRPGRDGQRRLGRESKLLPRMVETLHENLKNQRSQAPNPA